MPAIAYAESFGDPGHESLHRQLRVSRVPLFTHAYRNVELFPYEGVEVVPLKAGLLDSVAAGVRRIRTRHGYRLPMSVEWRLMDRFLERGASAIHAYGGAAGARIAPVARRLGCRLITTLHGADGRDAAPDYAAALHELFDASGRVLAASPGVAERLAALGCPEDKLELLPFGVTLRPMRPRRATSGTVRAISVAPLRPVAGMPALVDAVALARRMGAALTLDIVGDGADRAKVLEAIDRSRLAGHVHLHGDLNEPRTQELIDAADIFVLNQQPAEEEEPPAAILEAMASGLCVVATRAGSIPQIVTADVSGVLLDSPGVAALARALADAAGDGGLRVAFGAAGRARVERDFDVARGVERLRELYQ